MNSVVGFFLLVLDGEWTIKRFSAFEWHVDEKDLARAKKRSLGKNAFHIPKIMARLYKIAYFSLS